MKKRGDPKSDDQKSDDQTKSTEPASEETTGAVTVEAGSETGPDLAESAGITASAEAVPDAKAAIEDTPTADEPQQDSAPYGEAALDYHAHDDAAEEAGHRSLAATALMGLVGVIVIASLTLWAAPRLAPHLPAGMAQYLMPGQIDAQGQIADLSGALAAQTAKSDVAIAGLNAEIAALSGRLDTAADSGQTEAAIAAARSATDAATSLATRIDTIEAELTSLRNEFGAVSSALSDAGANDSPASPEIAAAVAALSARLDNLAASVEDRTAALATRLDAVESSAAAALDVQTEALGEASSAIREARLQGAIDLLSSRLTAGLPYGEKLNELAELTGTAPPGALSAGAEAGLATAMALEASFGRYAQAAVAADVQTSAGDGTGPKALAWLRAQVVGRPTSEQPGDSVGAITSRIAARVKDGKLAEALTEAETLPAHSQAGLGGWLDQLRARVAADMALAGWRAEIGAGG